MSGMTTLAAEVSAFRLVGHIFGTSNIVWSSIIGLMLLYLSIGYYIGGRLADREPSPTYFFGLICLAAITTSLIPIISRPILLYAATALASLDAPIVAGAFAGVMLIFAIPITLLGCTSPFAIRILTTRMSEAGSVAGRVYALSTIGSILGSFLPVLVTIPLIGTRYTYILFSGALLITSLIGLLKYSARQISHKTPYITLVFLLATYLCSQGNIRPIDGLIYEKESAYNLIQVVERNKSRYLLLNEGQGIHSVYNPTEQYTGGSWDYFLSIPYFNTAPHPPSKVDNLLIIGLAAGTISNQYSHVYGDIPIDGIEIDPDIISVGNKYFNMGKTNLSTIPSDGRLALRYLPNKYSVIAVDAYRLPYIPWHLTTQEFFRETKSHLTTTGVLAINVGRTPTDRRLVDALSATLLSVYPTVHVIDVPNTFNSIVVATISPTSASNLEYNLANFPSNSHPLLLNMLEKTIQNLVPTAPSNIIFTDDRAPVEQLTDSILLNYLLQSSTHALPSTTPEL